MQLYAGTSRQFIDDAVQNRIGQKLKTSFFNHFRFQPSPGEVASWQNSLGAVCNVLQYASLTDHGIILEYQLPLSSKRLDCMVTGLNDQREPNAVVVELKQWSETLPSNLDGCVATFVAGRIRDVLHPSNQVGQYQQYLEDCQTVFTEGKVALAACSYLHNIQHDAADDLFTAKHDAYLTRYPLFTGDQAKNLAAFLGQRLGRGEGDVVMDAILESPYRASKKLLEHVSGVIRGQREYVLLDEQLVAYNAVLAQTRDGFHEKGKVAVLVTGGPGTGKSVVALNLIAELSRQGYNTHHATGSKAFTGNIRKILGPRASAQFRFSNQYMTAQRDEVDVIVLDEAHRLKRTSTNRFTAQARQSGLSQVDELIRAAKVTVFFIDDMQAVRKEEIGRSEMIREAAAKNGATLYEYELETQFRCNGSEAYVSWVENTLGVRRTPNVLWDPADGFDFRIVDSAAELERMIRDRHAEGFSARLTAGFCWPWSDPNLDGTLIPDVEIGSWRMPWNAKNEAGRLATGIPRADHWTSDPAGIDQVGCVYTAQGFEYDYCGVIFGNDLRYDPGSARWIGDPSKSRDSVVKRSGADFLELAKATYRVLLTRGLKGCYVYFLDPATRDFARSRME